MAAVLRPAALNPRPWPLVDPGGVFCQLVLLVGLGYTGMHVFAPGHRTPSWPLALMILPVPALTRSSRRW
jgi:hypothetical protein